MSDKTSGDELNSKWAAGFLPSHPFHALRQVWDDKSLFDVTQEITTWYALAVSHDQANYYEHHERARLAVFIYDLIELIEAMYFLLEFKLEKEKSPNAPTETIKHNLITSNEAIWISSDDISNPLEIIAPFIQKYDQQYVRHELWQFFDGVRFYTGPLLQRIMPYDSQNLWLLLYCSTEAAYIITSSSFVDLDGTVGQPTLVSRLNGCSYN